MKVICVSGKAGSGKDTCARIMEHALQSNGSKVLLVHYADLLKFICCAFFDWNGEKDKNGRTLLQHVGTDVIRKADPDYWVAFIANILSLFPDEWEYVLIPDARFPNELSYLTQCGFEVAHVRVVRPGNARGLTNEQLAHTSETALDGVEPDFVIDNNGGLEELMERVLALIPELFSYHQVTMDEWLSRHETH